MQVKVNQSSPTSPKTNPPQNQTNFNNLNQSNQINDLLQQLQQLLEKVSDSRQKVQQQLQANTLYPQPQQNNLSQEFIVKSTMKSSYIALRIENLLLGGKKKIVMSGLGYAIPILVDAVLLIRKDLGKKGININIENIELFEKTVETNGKNKVISGVRVTLSI